MQPCTHSIHRYLQLANDKVETRRIDFWFVLLLKENELALNKADILVAAIYSL
jgi:hypothetical protein